MYLTIEEKKALYDNAIKIEAYILKKIAPLMYEEMRLTPNINDNLYLSVGDKGILIYERNCYGHGDEYRFSWGHELFHKSSRGPYSVIGLYTADEADKDESLSRKKYEALLALTLNWESVKSDMYNTISKRKSLTRDILNFTV